jgi:hypothetical protein
MPVRRKAASLILPLAVLLAHPVPGHARCLSGVLLDGPGLELRGAALGAELDAMRRARVGLVRLPVSWSQTEPARGRLELAALDAVVGAAADRGLRVMPVVLDTPPWAMAERTRAGAPRGTADFARYMTALVRRYGPRGTLWAGRRRAVPVRRWQLWNEPHLPQNWRAPVAWPRGYGRLARAAARAVHRADPRAEVVLAGLATDTRVAAWDQLDAVLAEGVAGDVDAYAIHLFTSSPANVVRGLRRARQTLDAYGLRRAPLHLTEWSWPSSRGRLPGRPRSWERTEAGQAREVRATLRALRRAAPSLRLEVAALASWLSRERGPETFGWAGLRAIAPGGGVRSKPALGAFSRTVRELGRQRC